MSLHIAPSSTVFLGADASCLALPLGFALLFTPTLWDTPLVLLDTVPALGAAPVRLWADQLPFHLSHAFLPLSLVMRSSIFTTSSPLNALRSASSLVA